MKNTTRILTWNLGLFTWCHWGGSLRVSINGNPVRHEFFQKANGNFIAEKIREINPDICVLEEFKKESDRLYFIDLIRDVYNFRVFVDAWYGRSTILILSKKEIVVSKLGSSEFYQVKTHGLSIVPIHLNSFYPWVRNRQVKELIKDIRDGGGIDVILGDTNIWSVTKLHLPVFWYDKMSTKLLEKNFAQVTRAFGSTTKYGLNLDKIFVNKKLSFTNPKVVRENAKYMDHYPVYVDLS